MATNAAKSLNWPRIVKTKLLPELPRFSAQGRLLYEIPVGDVLRAFQIEVSGFTKTAIYLECFVLPLYVPQTHISFDFGQRLRDPDTGAARWEVVDEAQTVTRIARVMRGEGMAFLGEIRDAGSLLCHLGSRFGSVENPHTLEAMAYSQVLAGVPDRARETLSKLMKMLDLSVGWEREMSERAGSILALVSSGDLEARRQLATWRALSMQNLKLRADSI